MSRNSNSNARQGGTPALFSQTVAGIAALVLGLAAFGCGGGSDDPASHSGEEEHASWGYSESDGPATWASIEPEYRICDTGKRQSPINITGTSGGGTAPSMLVDYGPEKSVVENNGHAIEVQVEDPEGSVSVRGKDYEIERFHFHTPSEEKIDGKRFDASIHLVNTSADGETAVIGLLVEVGPPNPVMDQVVPLIPDTAGDENAAPDRIDPGDLLPADNKAFQFKGSPTTPPCAQGLEWIVYRQPVTMSEDQLAALRAAYDGNIRPIQPTNGRRITLGGVESGGQ